MPRTPTPFDMIRPAMMMTQMLAEAQVVIALRLWGMAGGWHMAPSENLRMITEKTTAARQSGLAMARAAAKGENPMAVAEAGLKPVSRRTKANVSRLSRGAMRGKQ